MVKRRPGYTLVELMMVSAILALLFSLGSSLLMKVNVFFRSSIGKIETQRDVRNLLNLISKEIRAAKSSTVAMSRLDATQPPYSQIAFINIKGETVTIWQSGRSLLLQKNAVQLRLSMHLRSILFSFPSTTDPSLVRVLLTIEKSDGTGRTQALQLGGESVRVVNE